MALRNFLKFKFFKKHEDNFDLKDDLEFNPKSYEINEEPSIAENLTWLKKDTAKNIVGLSSNDVISMKHLIKKIYSNIDDSKDIVNDEDSPKVTALFWLAQRYALTKGVSWEVNYIWNPSLVHSGKMGWSVFSYDKAGVDVYQLTYMALTNFLQENYKILNVVNREYFSTATDSNSFNDLENFCHQTLNTKLSTSDFKSILTALDSHKHLERFYLWHLSIHTPIKDTSMINPYEVLINHKVKILPISAYKSDDYLNRKPLSIKNFEIPTVNSSVILIKEASSNTPTDHKQKASFDKLMQTLCSPIRLTASTVDIVSILREEFPWAENVCKEIDNRLTLSNYINQKYFKLPPLLLVGLPGCGKTRFAKRLAELATVNYLLLSGAGVNSGMMINGLEQGWGNADSNSLLKSIATWKEANPLFIIDEIDKTSSNKEWGSLGDSLLPFLEPSTSSHILDSFLMTHVDYSYCNWIATANDASLISAPLLSRFIVLNFSKPSREHTHVIASQTRIDLAKQYKISVDELPVFTDLDVEKLKPKAGQVFSAREVRNNSENLLAEKAKNSQRSLNLVSNNPSQNI